MSPHATGDATISEATNGEITNSQKQNNAHVGDTFEVPAFEPHASFVALKGRIKLHYDLASDYYYSLWGQHIHHGYFTSPDDTKEIAQVKLIKLLLETSNLPRHQTVLDVGCGLGGTTRYLAREHGCNVTGVTISSRQVEMAKRLSKAESTMDNESNDDWTTINEGQVRFLELDAETIGTHFEPGTMDCVWISEALSHFPNTPLFFANAASLLRPGGKLVIADWFKAEDVTPAQMESDIKVIEDGMLLPPMNTISGYVKLATDNGLGVVGDGPKDISQEVRKTWDISWSLIQNPSLWAFAISQGRDGLAFLQSFRAMRRGYANGCFRYGVMAFEKKAA